LSDRTRSAELAALTNIAAQVNCTQDLDEILAGALETTLKVIGEVFSRPVERLVGLYIQFSFSSPNLSY